MIYIFYMRIRWTILQYGFKHAFFGANKIWLRLKFYFPDEKLCLIVHRCSYFLKCLLLITIAQGRFHKLSAIWNSIIIFEIKIIGPGLDKKKIVFQVPWLKKNGRSIGIFSFKALFWWGNRAIIVGMHYNSFRYIESTAPGSKIEQAVWKYDLRLFEQFFFKFVSSFHKWKKV